MEVISRAEAKASGQSVYFTGKPCPKDHISERRTSNGECAECGRLYAKHKMREKMKDPSFRAADLESSRERRLRLYSGKEYQVEKYRRWKMRVEESGSSESVRERSNMLRRIRESENAESREKARENFRRWSKANPQISIIRKNKRRALKINATPRWYGELDEFVMREAAELCRLRELATGLDWHVDHMVPLQAKEACGLHCAANLQVIPARLNVAKKNRMNLTEPFEWMSAL